MLFVIRSVIFLFPYASLSPPVSGKFFFWSWFPSTDRECSIHFFWRQDYKYLRSRMIELYPVSNALYARAGPTTRRQIAPGAVLPYRPLKRTAVLSGTWWYVDRGQSVSRLKLTNLSPFTSRYWTLTPRWASKCRTAGLSGKATLCRTQNSLRNGYSD